MEHSKPSNILYNKEHHSFSHALELMLEQYGIEMENELAAPGKLLGYELNQHYINELNKYIKGTKEAQEIWNEELEKALQNTVNRLSNLKYEDFVEAFKNNDFSKMAI